MTIQLMMGSARSRMAIGAAPTVKNPDSLSPPPPGLHPRHTDRSMLSVLWAGFSGSLPSAFRKGLIWRLKREEVSYIHTGRHPEPVYTFVLADSVFSIQRAHSTFFCGRAFFTLACSALESFSAFLASFSSCFAVNFSCNRVRSMARQVVHPSGRRRGQDLTAQLAVVSHDDRHKL